jgi:predicted transcriptional regulator
MTSVSTPLTVQLPVEIHQRLEQLSEQTGQNLSDLVGDALREYIAIQESQIASIQEAVAEADAGARRIPHAEVSAWLESLGTPDELPPPA